MTPKRKRQHHEERPEEKNNNNKQIFKSILDPADLPELIDALPSSFPAPLIRLILDHTGCSSGFHQAWWRIDPLLTPPYLPHWMSESFYDWCNIVVKHPLVVPIAPPAQRILGYAVSSSTSLSSSTPCISSIWVTTIYAFMSSLARTYFSEIYPMCMKSIITKHNQYLDNTVIQQCATDWEIYFIDLNCIVMNISKHMYSIIMVYLFG